MTDRCRRVAFELEKVLPDVNPANCMTLATEHEPRPFLRRKRNVRDGERGELRGEPVPHKAEVRRLERLRLCGYCGAGDGALRVKGLTADVD